MGKRMHKDSSEYIKAKIRKLEKRLRRRRRRDHESSYTSDTSDHTNWDRASSIQSTDDMIELVDENMDIKSADGSLTMKSIVNPVPSTSNQDDCVPVITAGDQVPTDSIHIDILDMLGDSKKKQEVFGPKIQEEEISKRWGRILCEGLKKEQKKEIIEKILIPENFQLLKAPKLNPEIAIILNESTRNRDKRLESNQNYLGMGIAVLTNVISTLVDKDMAKIDLIKHLSEVNQILLDLHFENTSNRRKLITYSLDKKFLDIVQEVERDSLLFGENLSDKIKASKSAEKSDLEIKKANSMVNSTSKKPAVQQGNWRGPPRQSQRGNRRGGAKTRQNFRSSRTAASHTDRRKDATNIRSRPRSRTR